MRTTSSSLQAQLDSWSANLQQLLSIPLEDRKSPLIDFVRTFVPPDVTEEDIQHFADNLFSDVEFFQSFVRDVGQCASGDGVESIEGNQIKRAEFIILPPQGALSEGSNLDIVRQVAYVCGISGTWRAEG